MFGKKKCCKNLITLKNGNLVFKSSLDGCKGKLQAMMLESCIFDENLYFDLYEAYKAYYVVYDLIPSLLTYKLLFIFNKRHPNYNFNNRFTIQTICPSGYDYSLLPKKLRIPEKLENTLIRVFERVEMYLEDQCRKELDESKYLTLLRTSFLSDWEMIFRNESLHNEIFLKYQVVFLHQLAKVENKTIVKNVIERMIQEEEIFENTKQENHE